jgi:hypothetical protein
MVHMKKTSENSNISRNNQVLELEQQLEIKKKSILIEEQIF